MIDGQLAAFVEVFLRVRRVFPLRAAPDEIAHVQGLYFRVLRRFTLEQVTDGADAWIERGTRFPKPVEWIRAMPRRDVVAARIEPLLEPDASEYLAAVQRKYQGDPCGCFLCVQAGVSHRFLRYVPDVDVHDTDLRAELDGRIVVRGHWAHGEELQRWYAAHEAHWALRTAYGPKSFPGPPKKHTRAEFEAVLAAERRAAAVQDAINATTDIAELLS
jgi:hypothetical protein